MFRVISIRKTQDSVGYLCCQLVCRVPFVSEIILVLVYSGVNKALSSVCLLNKRAVYSIDWLNHFFRVQRSMCDEDNREGKSIIYWGGCSINYIWLNSEINLSDGEFKQDVQEQTVTKCPQQWLIMAARAQAQSWLPRSRIRFHSLSTRWSTISCQALVCVPGNTNRQLRVRRPCTPGDSDLRRERNEGTNK